MSPTNKVAVRQKFFHRIALITVVIATLLTTQGAQASPSHTIYLTVTDHHFYEYREDTNFPSTLKQSDVDFSYNIARDCTRNGKGMTNKDAILFTVISASGARSKDFVLKTKARISSFKWGVDENGENILRVTMLCTRTGAAAVVQSNSYSIEYHGSCTSPMYSLATLNQNNWKIRLKNDGYIDDCSAGGLWNPSPP